MASPSRFALTHLSVFTHELHTGRPLVRMPVYAEVAMTVPGELPAVVDSRFDEPIRAALREADSDCFANPQCRDRLVAAARAAIARVLAPAARDELAQDPDRANAFARRIFRRAREANGNLPVSGLDDDTLRQRLEAAVRAEAERQGLALNPPPNLLKWTHPLGILGTDHTGYLSFDLTRLPAAVHAAVVKAIEARKEDPNALLETAVLVYPTAQEAFRFDALAQGRFAHDAILLKIEMLPPNLPAVVRNLGLLAMQSPGLTDWRLSPASFAANPGALVGQDGCESLLPANVAVQEFHFYQVVRLTDVEPQPGHEDVKLGVVHDYKHSWYSLGHSLGQVLYSLPLAPGESVNLAVIDWTRRDEAERTEQSKLDEHLVHNQRRERTITETVSAAIKEYQEGSSFMAGLAHSVGASASLKAVGLAAGSAKSIGGASSDSSGSRDIAANTVQKVSDNVSQVSSAMREFQSTVVVRSAQSEKQAIETRTVANYNHSHTLTILYYEVLRHFRLVTELAGRRPAVLVKMKSDWFLPPNVEFTIQQYRPILEAALLEPRYVEALNAAERIAHRRELSLAAAAPLPAAVPDPRNKEFRFFTFQMKTGGLFSEGGNWIDINATLVGSSDVRLVGVDPGPPDVILNPPGSFRHPNLVNIFAAKPENGMGVKWDAIQAIHVGIHPNGNASVASFKLIKVIGHELTGETTELLVQNYEADGGGEMVITQGARILLPTHRPPPPPPAPPRPAEEIEDEAKLAELSQHLRHYAAHYSRAILLNQNPADRAALLDDIKLADQSSALDHVENRPLEVVGDYVAYPASDSKWHAQILEALRRREVPDVPPDERLVTVPTRGVFAEAKLGHCNASEEIDNTRFWDWQQSPIPHFAPEIAPVQPVTPQPQQQDVRPSPFPQSLVNIVNPPNAPDPSGLAAALSVLGTPNIFRDMSGRAEVADLLQRLSNNTIGIAEAANRARQIQSQDGGAAGGGGVSAGAGGATGFGGQRAAPNQPSAVNRDLHDRLKLLQNEVQAGRMSPEAAAIAGEAAFADASPSLQQVGDKYVRPATDSRHIAGIIGEVTAEDALRANGHIVFSDWRKHIAGTGFDMASYDPATAELWIIDNKAQMRGISDASALTGPPPNVAEYTNRLRYFLDKIWPNAEQAAKALEALNNGRVKYVVVNGFAGEATRFTKGLFDKGLYAFDIRLGKLYGPGEHAAWETAYKALKLKKVVHPAKGARATGLIGGSLFSLGAYAGAAFLLRDSVEFVPIAGEVAVQIALDTVLARLPGGFFASLVIGLESDESPQQRAARKLNEQIDLLISTLPDWRSLSPTDLKTTRETLKQMIQNPIMIPEPTLKPPSKRQFGGFQYAEPGPDWA